MRPRWHRRNHCLGDRGAMMPIRVLSPHAATDPPSARPRLAPAAPWRPIAPRSTGSSSSGPTRPAACRHRLPVMGVGPNQMTARRATVWHRERSRSSSRLSTRETINAHYARQLFARIKAHPYRSNFKVIVGGSGSWQIIQTDAHEDLGVDCVVEGRSKSSGTMEVVRRAIRGEPLPHNLETGHLTDRDAFLTPQKRITFGWSR